MGWIHTGGGYYENEETNERIRGKANLPQLGYIVTTVEITAAQENIVCMTCHKVTVHTPRPSDSTEWASYTCSECEGKTRVRLS